MLEPDNARIETGKGKVDELGGLQDVGIILKMVFKAEKQHARDVQTGSVAKSG